MGKEKKLVLQYYYIVHILYYKQNILSHYIIIFRPKKLIFVLYCNPRFD